MICPDVFQIDDHDYESQLRTLIVNLSLHEEGVSVSLHARHCEYTVPNINILCYQLLNSAKAATFYFPHLRIFRVLHPIPPSF